MLYLRRRRPQVLLALDTRANRIAVRAKRWFGERLDVWPSLRNALPKPDNDRHATRQLRTLRSIAEGCDGIIAISQGLADEFRSLTGADSAHVHVIHNPVVNDVLRAKLEASVSHPWLTANRQVPVVLTVARLEPQKDLKTLLRAIAVLNERCPCRLLVIGEGKEAAALASLAADLGVADQVDWLGFQINPYAYMKQADLFVLSSRSEGFGNVLVEALAAGVPVVSTRCPHGPLEILADGRYGALVPVGDWRALAAAMATTLAKPPSVEILRQRAEVFTMERCGARYMQVLGLQEAADGRER
ncbi:hypothetical protein CAI21_07740 [Alkalilimnicola ehrlichii]|uniref:Glycosyl transferase n=1 Tax=Alkalilimnicola ehrlichii TaxID=351052 RepID=A0A3E0WWQ1_9GAMM|nr:glycosyltransferase [Alkalilimnicola ehrlichii]RFA30085.1 hypothetical protein CAI21_07740 [Alkalilimnicola ehrlichii]RFA37430.1 hypothetical protein CAL65_09080 [Alkalilimnicola ehrlichii]